MNNSLWFKGEKWMVWTGLLGFVLALACGAWSLLTGDEELGARLLKAFSFNAALGIFLLSTAAITPYSGMGNRGKALFRWAYIALALYSYTAETMQHIRGVNPRFAMDGPMFDQWISTLFGAVALLLVAFYVFFGVQFFRKRASRLQPTIVLGIRYAIIGVLLSFVGGILISVNGGRYLGAEGNLIWFHGMGFHALQALPLIAWLVCRGTLSERFQRTLLHISGIAFVCGLAAMGAQTMLERPLLEWEVLPLAALALFLVTTAAGMRALLEAWRHRQSATIRGSING